MNRIVLFLIILYSSFTSYSQIPQPQKQTYINDYAKVLSNAQVTDLNKQIFYIEKEQSVQLAIVLVDNVPAAYDIQDFAVLIGKKWHVGKNKRGIVYVAAIDQHKQRIEVARNLDSIFTTAKCLEIMDKMKPSFRNKDYSKGLAILIKNINTTLQGVNYSKSNNLKNIDASAVVARAQLPKQDNDTLNTWVGFAFIVVLISCIVAYIKYRKRKNAEMVRNFEQMNSGAVSYNPGQDFSGVSSDSSQGYSSSGGGGYSTRNRRSGSRWGGILGGAAVGAAAGYGARVLQDKLNHRSTEVPQNNNFDTSADDEPRNWGNWGDGADDSSYDSGFSDDASSDDSSGSGATSDW